MKNNNEKDLINNYKKKISKLVNDQRILIIIMLILMMLTAWAVPQAISYKCPTYRQYFSGSNIHEFLDKLEKDCGSTFLVKGRHTGYGDEWTVYKDTCLEGGWCKNGYIKLEDCLK